MKHFVMMVVALVGIVGCSKSSSDKAGGGGGGGGDDKTYKIGILASKDTVTVTAKVPSDWKEKLDNDGSPNWTFGDYPLPQVSVVAIGPSGKTDKERLDKAIGLQFDSTDGKEIKREDKPDGRVWMEERQKERLHARMFLTTKDAIVMCVVMIKLDDPGLATAPGICDSVRVK